MQRNAVLQFGVMVVLMTNAAPALAGESAAGSIQQQHCAVMPTSTFDEVAIRSSRLIHHAPDSFTAQPAEVFKGVDMRNLFIVVEAGDQHVTVLDGDTLEPIHRFHSRPMLQGSPKFTPDGRYVFFASRDGWITKFDIWNLNVVAEIRTAIDTHNIAISQDGKYLAVANCLPNALVLLDADLRLLKVHAAVGKAHNQSSRISTVYDAAPRRSFIVALRDAAEVWELSYNPKAEDIAIGTIHDFQYKEGAFIAGFLNPRRTFLSDPIDDFNFTPNYNEMLIFSREAAKGQVVQLDVRQKIADLNLPDKPLLGSAITWNDHSPQSEENRTVMAIPSLTEDHVTVVDLKSRAIVKTIPTLGPGLFLRSHENTPYAWTDSIMSNVRGTLQVIDKRTLEKVTNVKSGLGKTLAHLEFTRDGKYLLASLSERKADGGALIVFDAVTFKEVKRIPMDKPVGTYNLHNSSTRSGVSKSLSD